ncbi:hypothetical protein ACP70R_032145 [Stipagrostis hirtigluma subsp. patula]
MAGHHKTTTAAPAVAAFLLLFFVIAITVPSMASPPPPVEDASDESSVLRKVPKGPDPSPNDPPPSPPSLEEHSGWSSVLRKVPKGPDPSPNDPPPPPAVTTTVATAKPWLLRKVAPEHPTYRMFGAAVSRTRSTRRSYRTASKGSFSPGLMNRA